MLSRRACILLAGALSCPLSALAEPFGELDATLPPGWSHFQEGELDGFISADGENSITVFTARYALPDPAALATARAGANLLADLGPSAPGFGYADATGARIWGMMAADGDYAEIYVNGPHAGTLPFLDTLRATEDAGDGLTGIVAAARSPQVAAWLGFAVDPQPVPFAALGLVADVPPGWGAAVAGDLVRFAPLAGHKDSYVTARRLPLTGTGYDAFVLWATEEARLLGGHNLMADEGSVEFQLPDGVTGIFTLFGNEALALTLAGEAPGISELAISIMPGG